LTALPRQLRCNGGTCIEEHAMLKWALIFAVIALVAGLFGFTGIAAGAASVAKVLFFLFVVLCVIALVLGMTVYKAVK
jgi:uncharacterized membrane protein YtjA (UPF0391 family)